MGTLSDALGRFRRRRKESRLVQADADALVLEYGSDHAAYFAASQCELKALLGDGTPFRGRTAAQWRRVAHLIAMRESSTRTGASFTRG